MARSVEYVYYLRDFFTRHAMAMAASAKKVAGSTRAAAAGVALLGAALTVAGVMALAGMVTGYAAWEERLASVHKVMLAAAGDFKHVKNAIRELSSELPYARAQIAAFFDEGIRASVADPSKGPIEYARQLKIFAKLAGETSFAFDMPADRAAEMLAKIKSSLGLTMPAMKQYMQQINFLGDTMATKEKDILEIVRRVAALAQSGTEKKYFQKARENVAALGAAMTAAGARSEVAATGIRNFMLRAGKGKYAPKETLRAFKWLRINPTKFAKLMSSDVLTAAELALVRIGKIKSSEKRNAAIAGLFGLKAVDAFSPLLARVGPLIKQARDLTEDLARRSTRWGNALQVKLSTINAHLIPMKNALSFLRDGFVVEWVDEIKWAADGIRDMADALNEMPTFKKITGGVIAAMLVIGPLLIMLGLMAMSLSALGVTAATFGAFLSLVFGPVGLAVAAFAGAAYLVITNWESVKTWFGGFGSYVTDAMSGIGEVLAGIFSFDGDMILSGLGNLQAAIINAMGHLLAPVGAAFKAAFSLVGIELPGLDVIKAKLDDVAAWFSQTFSFNIDWPEIPGWMKKVGNWFAGVEAPGARPTSVPSVPASQQVVDSMAKRMQIETRVKSEVSVTSKVDVTAPSSIELKVNGQIGGHIPLGTNASRGQNMATSTTGQTVSE